MRDRQEPWNAGGVLLSCLAKFLISTPVGGGGLQDWDQGGVQAIEGELSPSGAGKSHHKRICKENVPR